MKDKAGPLEERARIIISHGFLMAEDINGYLCTLFNGDDISSLPVPYAKFQEAKPDYLGPLIVSSEMVAQQIKTTKDNKSTGMDGIPPRLLI